MTAALDDLVYEIKELMTRVVPEDLSEDEVALVVEALRSAEKRVYASLTPVVHLTSVRPGKRRRR
jgi:hypothetical protein